MEFASAILTVETGSSLTASIVTLTVCVKSAVLESPSLTVQVNSSVPVALAEGT